VLVHWTYWRRREQSGYRSIPSGPGPCRATDRQPETGYASVLLRRAASLRKRFVVPAKYSLKKIAVGN